MVASAKAETKLVTGKINGQDVTVPAGTTILEASRMAGVEVPNLCYQPLLRPWGSCRICTVEVLGKRGGLIESCATPITDGMEVLTHSPACEQARQYVLQMYLIDHALDCPTCDKSGECYLQDNTYLHNVNANPYRRPKLAQPYEHFSATIDYKWDRCIMCNRCTRVCDEMVGVVAIEGTSRSLEASIAPAFNTSLEEGTCVNCGMCIAVCPVGALTDRHFGHHPWELDTTETICGFCDGGCTINVETNKGVIRRITHLWDRGTNHGYTCEMGKWGYTQVQHPDRLLYPTIRDSRGAFETTWDDAVEQIVEGLEHHQGSKFAALGSPDQTNEEAYLLQMFARAVMGSNNIDRYQTPSQVMASQAATASFGLDIAGTNNLQELFTDLTMALIVGPDISLTAPIVSYFLHHARHYREAKLVVVSPDESSLAKRAALWIKPNLGMTNLVLKAIGNELISAGVGKQTKGAKRFDIGNDFEAKAGVPLSQVRLAAALYASGGRTTDLAAVDASASSAIFLSAAHLQGPGKSGLAVTRDDGQLTPAPVPSGKATWWSPTIDFHRQDDPAEMAVLANNLAVLSGNIGRPGGGVASLRGGANFQGVTDMGVAPARLPGAGRIDDPVQRALFAESWLPRWAAKARTSNGFVPVQTLPEAGGLSIVDLPEAIERGEITALYIEDTLQGRFQTLDPRLEQALSKLQFMVLATGYTNSPLARYANVVLPLALYLEKDGTFTAYDRTVQRVRASVPALGEARSGVDIISTLAQRFGFDLAYDHPARVMTEIATLVESYRGINYARLERNGVVVPTQTFVDPGVTVLSQDRLDTLIPQFAPSLVDLVAD